MTKFTLNELLYKYSIPNSDDDVSVKRDDNAIDEILTEVLRPDNLR